MFLPFKDENPSRSFPFVTILLIMANIGIYVYQMILGELSQSFVYQFGIIPWEMTHFQDHPTFPLSPIPNGLTLLTAMFLHGSWFHVLGNMLYLWIFGDNVEATLGHFRFLIFYLVCGLIASLTHIAFYPNSTIPVIGASGAISGILGAYFLLFPGAYVQALFFFFYFIRIVRIPAFIVLGLWFLLQLFSGLGSLTISDRAGVAWFAHIGGFVAGMILILFFPKKKKKSVIFYDF